MKRILTTAATALVLGTSAYADGHAGAFSDMTFDINENLNASEMIGMRVYASEASIEGDVATGSETEWDDIGEINEIVLTRSGEVQSVIVGVGGFLGINEKDVAINMDQLQFVTEEGEADDFFLVIKATAVGVQDAPAYEYSQLTNTLGDEEMTDAERTYLTRPSVATDGYTQVTMDDFNTEDLTGARVYGLNDEDVGEVSELLLTENGTIDRAIIDVGGFLGLGEKPIAVTMDEIQIVRSDADANLRVYIDSTQEALEAQPTYEG